MIHSKDVFMNIPYDAEYEKLFLALIGGLTGLGLTPRCTLEISETKNRLDRICDLIKSCPYSLHDMSRVELSRSNPKVPRFNMPFEAGLAIAFHKIDDKHKFYLLETRAHRLQKSLSDLNGYDPQIHNGTVVGMMRVLTNIFNRKGIQPTPVNLKGIYSDIKKFSDNLKVRDGMTDIYTKRPFSDLVVAARESAEVRGFKF